MKLEGFARVRLVNQDKSLAGDSGWMGPNRITQTGLTNFIADVLISDAGSLRVGMAQLGTGAAPATNDTRLPGSFNHGAAGSSYDVVSKSSLTASNACTARFYGTFGSGDSFATATRNISNIGLYRSTALANMSDESLCCGQTYASSLLSTNQDVQYTYELRFATA
jgi:hypothetical protein